MKTQASKTRIKDRHFQEVSSGDRKKSRTRGLILDTAIGILAEKGIDRTSIVEVAERAGMSNASFYYHFRDKAELIDAVAGSVAATLVREVDAAIADFEEGSQRVALATMLFIERGVADRAWGGLIVHALAELGEFREQIFAGVQKDVRIGIAQGRFNVADEPVLYAMLLAMVSASMRERLHHQHSTDIAATCAEAVLRVLGLDAQNAAEIIAEAKEQIANGLPEHRLD